MDTKIKVYYDGLCHLCSREIDHYKKMRGAEQIEFLDITASNFDASIHGLDSKKVHTSFHVKNRQGQILTGVDAFIVIWKELPALRFLVKIANLMPIKILLQKMYDIFAILRPYLPRKSCEQSPYCDVRRPQ